MAKEEANILAAQWSDLQSQARDADEAGKASVASVRRTQAAGIEAELSDSGFSIRALVAPV